MNDSVLNEYVHVDRVGIDTWNAEVVVVYEPLDSHAERHTLEGTIVITGQMIPFHMGNHHLLVDSDLVLQGDLQNNKIALKWKNHPGEHYLTVSYDIVGEKQKVAWLKEGF